MDLRVIPRSLRKLDMADQERESRKRQFRKRMITAENISYQLGLRDKKRRWVTIGILAFLLLLFVVLFQLYLRRTYHHVSLVFSGAESAAATGQEKYESFAGGLLRASKDGASFIHSSGKAVWNQAYEMNRPQLSVNGNFACIYDPGSNEVYIMNTKETTGIARTTQPIRKAVVSGKGVVYALMDNADTSYISVFSKEGAALDISLRSVLGGEGYPMDLSLSPDGTELLVSYASVKGGRIRNKLVFYNFSEVGQNADPNRVVGSFQDDFDGFLIGRVHFSGDTEAEVFYDGGIAFFSTRVLASPKLVKKVEIPEQIRSVAYDGDYVMVITDNTGAEGRRNRDFRASESETEEGENAGKKKKEEYPYRLMVFKSNGRKLCDRSFDFSYSGVSLSGKYVLLYREKRLVVYSLYGHLRFTGELTEQVETALVPEGMQSFFSLDVMTGGNGRVERVKLK